MPDDDAPATSSKPPAGRRLKELGFKVGLLVGTGLVTLLLGECTMHLAGIGSPQFHDVHETFGTAPIPGAEGEFDAEGHSHTVITRWGYRGVTVTPDKPEGTFRLAVLGDSYAEARHVELEETFAAQLEERLAGCPAVEGRDVEVVNFGVAGYSTSMEYLTLRERALDWDPDAVMLAFLSGNDVSGNSPELHPGQYPYYELEDGELVLNDDFARSDWFRSRQGGPLAWVRRHSRIYQLINRLRASRPTTRQQGEAGLADEVYAAPETEAWTDAWAVVEALLARMHRELAADERPFFVITLSNAIQVDPDPERRREYMVRIGVEDLDYPDRRVAAAGARDGYPVLNLAPALRAYAEAHDAYLHGFENTAMGTGHWNATGHRVASVEMARWLCEQLGG